MDCCYINLDAAAQRRQDIEASFARAARPVWTLQRFPALDGDYVERHQVPGSRSRAIHVPGSETRSPPSKTASPEIGSPGIRLPDRRRSPANSAP